MLQLSNKIALAIYITSAKNFYLSRPHTLQRAYILIIEFIAIPRSVITSI